jgi:hypothetical protein
VRRYLLYFQRADEYIQGNGCRDIIALGPAIVSQASARKSSVTSSSMCYIFFCFVYCWTGRKRNSSVTYQNFSSYCWETFQRTFHNHRLTRRMDNNYLKSNPPNTVRLHEDSTYATLLALGRFQTTWFPSKKKKFFLLNLVFVTKCVRKAIWTNIF